jgi:hypothetical protein
LPCQNKRNEDKEREAADVNPMQWGGFQNQRAIITPLAYAELLQVSSASEAPLAFVQLLAAKLW